MTVSEASLPYSPTTINTFVFDVLPEDIIQLLFHALPGEGGRRQYLPPTALVEFACTCKAAAAIALPALYSNLFLPSLPALPQVFATLASPRSPFLASLKLRNHVRSATVSPYFVCEEQFHLLAEAFQTGCKLDEKSWIVSTDLVNQRFTRETLEKLPMHCLAQIAAVCPNLVSVDLSNVPYLGSACPVLLYGFRALACILRPRGGRFTSAKTTPVSAVLARDDPQDQRKFIHDAYFVTRVDWARKEIDVTNQVDDLERKVRLAVCAGQGGYPADLCLIPFADLVGQGDPLVADDDEQTKWAIRDIRMRIPPAPNADWLTSETGTLTRAGIRKGKDRIFNLMAKTRPHPVVRRNVTYVSPFLRNFNGLMLAHKIDAESQCVQLEMFGASPAASWSLLKSNPELFQERVKERMADFCSLSLSPFLALTRFVLHNSYFLTMECGPAVLKVMSAAMPNLTDLTLLNFHAPMDFFMTAIDSNLIRRLPAEGKTLHHLRMSAYVPANTTPNLFQTYYPYLPPERGTIGETHYTHLDATKPTRNHLRSLQLSISGPGARALHHFDLPKLAIHPGILHGLDWLTLHCVKLVVIPPHLVRPTTSSFLPIAGILSNPSPTLAQITPLTLEHVTLPNLRHLRISSKSLVSITSTNPTAPHRLPTSLPACPNLASLAVHHDCLHRALDLWRVRGTLARYPTVVSVRIMSTALARSDLRQLATELKGPLAPWGVSLCPRLRQLVVDNLGRASARVVCAPHVGHVDTLRAAAEVAAAMAKAGGGDDEGQPVRHASGAQVPWCDAKGKLVECDMCGKLVRVPKDEPRRASTGRRTREALTQVMDPLAFEMMSEEDEEVTEDDYDDDDEPVARVSRRYCPNCAPRYVEQVRVGSGEWDESSSSEDESSSSEDELEREWSRDEGDEGVWTQPAFWCVRAQAGGQ